MVDKFEHEEVTEFPHSEIPHIAEGTVKSVKSAYLAAASRVDQIQHALHMDFTGLLISEKELDEHHPPSVRSEATKAVESTASAAVVGKATESSNSTALVASDLTEGG